MARKAHVAEGSGLQQLPVDTASRHPTVNRAASAAEIRRCGIPLSATVGWGLDVVERARGWKHIVDAANTRGISAMPRDKNKASMTLAATNWPVRIYGDRENRSCPANSMLRFRTDAAGNDHSRDHVISRACRNGFDNRLVAA